MIPIQDRPQTVSILDQLIQRDELLEIWQLMTPKQRIVAALRIAGLNDYQIGRLLGCTHNAVTTRISVAKRHIAKQNPELGRLLEGRERHHYGFQARADYQNTIDWSLFPDGPEEE